MRVYLMFGVIVSAALYMPNSRAYDEFHAYMIGFVVRIMVGHKPCRFHPS